MVKVIRAIVNVIKAEVELQNELAKKYPFGFTRDDVLLPEAVHAWRKTHSFSNYMNHSSEVMHRVSDMVVPKATYKQYTGAYGCFGSYIGNIVCQYSTDYVSARNPEEAMDLIYFSEKKNNKFYDEWLLTDLREINGKESIKLFNHCCVMPRFF